MKKINLIKRLWKTDSHEKQKPQRFARYAAILIMLLTLGVGQMWAYWYVPGTINGTRWGTTDNNMGGDNTITFYAVAAGTYSFQLTNGTNWSGNSCIKTISGATKGTDGSNATITTTAVKDITITVVDETNWKVSVTASDPTYHIKYQFGGSWGIKTLINNGDGTYSCNGNYSGSSTSGFNYIKVSSEGDDFMNWTTSGITRENSPSSTSDKCIFTFKPSDNTLKIRKCNTVTKTNYIYFYNRHSWSDSYIYFVIGHPEYSATYRVTNIANTKLYYVANSSDNWTDAGYYGMIGAGSTFGSGSWGQSNLAAANHYTAAYTTARNLANGKTILVTPNATNSNGQAMTISSDMSSYTGLNYSQTVQKRTCTGANDPSSVANFTQAEVNSGTVTISAYKMTGNGTASNTSNSATLDEASETSASVDAAYSGKVTYTASANTGYTFVGWTTTANGSIASTDATYNRYPTSSGTVYARFKENQYTAYVQTYTHGSSPSPSSATTMGQVTGGSVSVTPNTGYRFVNWTLNSGSGSFADANSASTTFYPTSNSQLRANIVAKTYTITLDDNGDYGGNGSATATYNSSTLSIASHATREDYRIDGYQTSGGTKVINADGSLVASVSGYTDGSSNWIKDDDVTLYAIWVYDVTNYTVTYGAGTDFTSYGSVSAYNNTSSAAVGDSPASVRSGHSVTFTATPETGYAIEGWYTDAACSSGKHDAGNSTYTVVSVTGDLNIYVKFVEITWSVAFAAGTGGSVTTPAATPQTVGQVTGISIEATPATGYTFNTWTITSGSGSFTSAATTNSNTFKPTAASTITASFNETKSTITVTTATSSQGSLKFGSTSKSWGATASLGVATTQEITATAAAGFRFVRWDLTGAAASASSLTSATITLKADGSGSTGTATAVFEEDLSSPWIVAGGNKIVTTGTTWRTTADANNSMVKKTGHSTESVVYFTVPVTSVCSGDNNENFQFKIYNTSTSTWYGLFASGSYYLLKAEDGTEKSLVKDNQNIELRAYVTGDYVLKLDYSTSTPKLTVTWPVYNQVRISAASPSDAGNVGNYDLSEPVSNVRTVTRSLKANTTYTFKIVYNSDFYGYNSGTFTRSNSTSSNSRTISTSGGNMTLTTDYAGDYTFKFNQSTKALSIDFPEAYKVTYGKGTVDGSSGSCSAKDIDNGNAAVTSNSTWVKSGNRVVLTAPAAKTGYTYNGWFDNNSGTGAAITTNANCTITVSSALTRYACYSINNHAITHSASSHGTYTIKVGSAAAVSTNTTSDYGKTITLAATPATGYHFGSWSAYKTGTPATTVTVTSNQFTMPDYAVTVGATFSPTTYSITYNTNGGSAIATGNYTIETATFSLPTTSEKTGYTFAGWYTNSELTGDPVASIAVGSYGNKEYWAKWTPNTYTVSFNVNGGTASTPGDKEVTYDAAYGTLPSGMTHTSKQFIGWYTDPDDGEGTHITAETIVSTASNHTLYAHYENVYSVNVNFKCGSDVIYPATSVDASPTSLAPTITAPEIFGYSFENWTGTNVTFADASSATTTITATAATSVTANYSVVPTVYFKNNLGWENVYVTFDSYWKEVGGKQVPGNKGKPYYKMTQIGSSDVYYCVIPETYTTSDYAGWAWNIAFDNTNYGSTAETTHTGTYDPFYGGKFTGRGDFDPKATMFIPYNGDTETRNGGTFYKSGCWMKYNSTESGYQVKMNEYVTGAHAELSTTNLTAPAAGGYEFSATVYLGTANYSYGFKLYKEYQKNTNDLWYTNTGGITHATDDLPWAFWSGSSITSSSQRCGLHTEALGNYKITVSFATGKPMVSVEYPVSTGDWKLIYKDLATWSGVAHTASWSHPSRVIKAKTDAEDIVSFYVAHGSSPSIELYKCTAIDAGTGAETWTKQSDVSLTGISKKGVYNFKVSQNGSKVATVTLAGEYDGNFYIRTDASNGGWTNYKTSGKNLMTYSEYSLEHGGDFGPYSHYFMRFASKGTNIKFCLANDYSECITDTVVDDTYTGEFIAADGNVRFMWNSNTNKIGRTYISGSSVVSDRFLVLEGDAKMFDESGNALTTAGGGRISGLNDYEMKFTDDENWIYEATVKAQPGARIKLTAKYNDKIQYFYGAEGDRSEETTDLLIGGSGTGQYKVRVVYDFKTNRLMRAFIPDATITTDLAINADLMIIREHQEQAQQISFSGDGALSDVKTVYGAMKFNKYTVNGKSKESGHASTGASRYERDLFYISFPFDVKLGDAFGFGEYGKHWIIEYYDGKGRAEKGFWADSEPNWKFVWPAQRSSFTMKAFEGYILALELDEMAESSSIWDNGVENVYVYFPSDGNVNNISATNRTITIDQEGYECKINRATPDGNRTVKDSYWHCIGVPSFANYSRPLSPTSGGETIDWSDDDGEIDWSTPNLPYLYVWNRVDNSLSVTTSATFDFKATWSYLVQYAGTSIYWSQVNVTPASIVARERTAPKNAEFRIELQKDGQKADQTFVRLTEDENVTTGFDFNYDLSKEFNKNKANLYTLVTTVKDGDASVTQSAANVLPMTEQTTLIPVGVKIAADGDYTFAIPDGTEGIGVTLIDNETGIHTSLSALDYTINLNAGTYDNRFVIEISPISQISTDIDNVQGESAQSETARKVMIDGILYIVKDGEVFDAHGNRVK